MDKYIKKKIDVVIILKTKSIYYNLFIEILDTKRDTILGNTYFDIKYSITNNITNEKVTWFIK